MESLDNKNQCPRCHSARLKSWEELGFEEKMLAEKMSASLEYSRKERQKHLFCPKCWFESVENQIQI